MIATILMVLLILDLIITIRAGDDDGRSSTTFGLVVLMALCIALGYTGTDSEKKAHLEEAISRGSHYATYEAYWYNKRLDFFDSYFYRFTPRPDSDYIDVEY